MDYKPKISVILPTYNQARYLPDALDGLLSQTFRDFELIVVNDGSTDNTEKVLDQYLQGMRFTVIKQANKGLPSALNTGFAQAKGTYLSWTSSDNITLPNMLEILNDTLDSDLTTGVVYADWLFINEVGKTIGQFNTIEYDRHLLLYFNYVNCCFLFRRECMDLVGGYDPEYIYGEDWEFWIRVSRHFKMAHVKQPLYQYRIHSKSMSAEVVDGTALQRVPYNEFKTRLKKQSFFDFYLSKVKWKMLSAKLGYDPRQRWLDVVYFQSH